MTKTLIVPDPNEILDRLITQESSYNFQTLKISAWIKKQKERISDHAQLIQENHGGKNDLRILSIFVPALLMRFMRGEKGEALFTSFEENIKDKQDLCVEKYKKVLWEAGYRWGHGDEVANVLVEAIGYFEKEMKWDWKIYLDMAEKEKDNNFAADPLLKIKRIKFKVRDLALSEFSLDYAALDLHVVRVLSRTGLLAHGWDLPKALRINYGTNQTDGEQYLFLHGILKRLEGLCETKYRLMDFDRIFWHFGRAVCKAKPKCSSCPIKGMCLTGAD